MRAASLLLVAAVIAVAGCSHAGDEDAAPATRPPKTSTPPPTTTRPDGDGAGGGFLEAVTDFLGDDETSRCVDEVDEALPPTSGGTTVAAVARDVERLRRLRFERLPKPRYLTGRALDRRIAGWLDEYPAAEASADGRVLIALGAIPPGSDLKELYRRALTGGVAGFYDPTTGELVVDAGEDRRLGGADRVTLAHELEHALVDQAVRLPDAVRAEEPPAGAEDAAIAASALVEGDATLVTDVYAAENLSFADALGEIVPGLASIRELVGLPHYITEGLFFPYVEGLRFVCELYERGGWRAVDRAYRKLPPSSAAVMFPERYLTGERPVDPPDPPDPGAGWRRIDRQALGAADLLLLFEAPGDDAGRELDDARERVARWAGGELHAWGRRGQTAVAIALVDRDGGGALCESMKAWRAAARVDGVVRCSGRHVRVGIAPDERTAARLVSS